MKLQRLLSLIRQAVDQYEMIEEGDHIAIGISGGKDSLTMLYALHGLRRFYEKHVRNHCGYGNRYHESGTNQSAVPGNSSSL